MKKFKYLSIIAILLLVLTGCGNNNDSSNENNNNKENSSKEEYYKNAKAVYFNPETGKKCNDYVEENSAHMNTSGCMKWYVYSTNNDGTVDMILDHGVSLGMKWADGMTNLNGPSKELLNTLKESTSLWNGVEPRKDSYSLDNGKSKYTIDYTGYRARLISAEEIKEIQQEESYDIYKAQLNEVIYVSGWITDKISADCEKEGCASNPVNWNNCVDDNGYDNCSDAYWTSTAYNDCVSEEYCENNGAYYVSDSIMRYEPVDSNRTTIRPVITIKKSIIE